MKTANENPERLKLPKEKIVATHLTSSSELSLTTKGVKIVADCKFCREYYSLSFVSFHRTYEGIYHGVGELLLF